MSETSMSQNASLSVTTAFLKTLLPSDGLKCGVIITNKKPRQFFVPTIEELAARLLAEDAKGGCDVYQACAVYTDSSSRKAGNARGSKAFWLDVDVGDTKPYTTLEQATAALDVFQTQVGLPRPILVSSGRGLHVYWPCEEAWGASEWKPRADTLKRLCVSHGFHADPARTGDIASILRPPGAHNRKGNGAELLVRLISFGGIHPRSSYEVLTKTATPVRAHQAPGKPTGLTADRGNVYSEEPADADVIAAQCGQIRSFRDSGGNIPEPQWYGAMAVVGRCVDGPSKVHEWSRGDERYNPDQTDAKLVRAFSLSGPTTCAHFAGINPQGCHGCPFAGKLSTPLQLGRHRGGDFGDGVWPSEASGIFPPIAEPPASAERLPALPLGFRQGHGGQLQFVSEGKNGEQREVTVSQYPLFLRQVTTGELKADKHHIAFRHWLPQVGWRDVALPARELAGPTAIAAMAEKGVVIEDGDLFRKYVRDAMNQFMATEKTVTQFDQCGWKPDGSFLYGTRLYSERGVETVATGADVAHKAIELMPKPEGSLGNWTSAANIFAAPGLEMHLYGVLAAFAAPFMRQLSSDEGGAILSFVTADSGRGKTTVLEAIASVWGTVDSLRLVSGDTRISKGLMFGVLGNLPMIYDEFDTTDPAHVVDFVQMFTIGRDKLRANKEGELKQSGAKWQTLLVTASNRSLVDSMQSVDNEAQPYRVFELNVQKHAVLKEKGDWVREMMKANAGHAGDKFLRYLVSPGVMPAVAKKLEAYRAKLVAAPWYIPEFRFWVRMHCAISVAAAIVERLGLISFSSDRIIKWGEDQLTAIGEAAPTKADGPDVAHALELLADYINDHRAEIILMPHEWKPMIKMVPLYQPAVRISARYNANSQSLFVVRASLREYIGVKRHYPYKEFFAAMKASGVWKEDIRIVLAAGSDIAGAQVFTSKFDLGHPAMTGVANAVEMGKVVELRKQGVS